ncbi:hypothetical protein ACWDSD_38305, partial [Streptomyces spiralis]
GLPVAFTTKVSNTGAYDTSSARLLYRIDGGAGLPSNAVSLQYRLSDTAWKTVPLTYADERFSGEVPETFPLAAGHSRTVQLRIGAYRKDTPAGKATVQPCVFVNGGSIPFSGTTSCGNHATLTVRASGSTGSTGGTPTPTLCLAGRLYGSARTVGECHATPSPLPKARPEAEAAQQ